MSEDKPTALAARQMIQKAMTVTREKIVPMEFDESVYDIVEVNVEIKDLDPMFHNYKIVNLSDLHLGQWLTAEYLEGVIEIVNKQKADMIALTGDYVSYILDDVADDLERCLSMLKVKDVSLAVLGNHDHWTDPDRIREILKNAGIIDISNNVYTIERRMNNRTAKLNVAGVDSTMLNKEDLDKVMEELPEEGPAIMLAHEPDFADITSLTGRFALQISGHSHGGQFIIPGLNTTILRGEGSQKYPVGEYKVGDMIQYTSKGLGTNVFWLRINCAPEITIFKLKSPEVEDKENKNHKKPIYIRHSNQKKIFPTREDVDRFLNPDDIADFIEGKISQIANNLNPFEDDDKSKDNKEDK